MLLHFTLEGEKGLGLCLPGPPPCWAANALQRVKERSLWGLSGPLAGAWLGGAEDAPSSLMPSLGGGCGAREPDRGPGTWFYASPQCGPVLAAVPRPCQTPEAAEGLGALNVQSGPPHGVRPLGPTVGLTGGPFRAEPAVAEPCSGDQSLSL